MSEQGLTERDWAILGAAFEPSEIGNNGGKPYVKPRAIRKRLRMVDPNYRTDIDTHIQVIGDVVTVWGGLSLKGVRHACSKSKNVNCWRKVQVDDKDASKGHQYVRVDEYEYARELANAIMKAKTGLLARGAETFDVGDYLKDKSSPTPPSLASVLKEQPQHWALNGGGQRFEAMMNQLGLKWADVQSALEPGKTLARLSDTTLDEETASRSLRVIAERKP